LRRRQNELVTRDPIAVGTRLPKPVYHSAAPWPRARTSVRTRIASAHCMKRLR